MDTGDLIGFISEREFFKERLRETGFFWYNVRDGEPSADRTAPEEDFMCSREL